LNYVSKHRIIHQDAYDVIIFSKNYWIVTCSLFAACGSEKRRSEDTSRSGKGLAPSALPHFLTLQ
jgi:hypothetical protein